MSNTVQGMLGEISRKSLSGMQIKTPVTGGGEGAPPFFLPVPCKHNRIIGLDDIRQQVQPCLL